MRRMKRVKVGKEKLIYMAIIMWKMKMAGQRIREQLEDEQGIGVVEVILILVVLIGLVIIFKSQLTSLVNTIFEKITSESAGI